MRKIITLCDECEVDLKDDTSKCFEDISSKKMLAYIHFKDKDIHNPDIHLCDTCKIKVLKKVIEKIEERNARE